MKTIRVVAKEDCKYVFRQSKRLLNIKVGQTTYLTKDEIYQMGSFYNRFFTERDETAIVDLFIDEPDELFNQWKDRNLL